MESKQQHAEYEEGLDISKQHYYPPIPSVATLSVGDTVKVKILQYDKTFRVFSGVVTDKSPFQPASVEVLYLNLLYNNVELSTVQVVDDDEAAQVVAAQVGDESAAVFKAKKILGERIAQLEKDLSKAREEATRVVMMFPPTVLRKDRPDPVM